MTTSSRILGTPLVGAQVIVSTGLRSFDRHWHDVYTFGVIDRGAQRWYGRAGEVEGRAGQIINTNPGEVHCHDQLRRRSSITQLTCMESHEGRHHAVNPVRSCAAYLQHAPIETDHVLQPCRAGRTATTTPRTRVSDLQRDGPTQARAESENAVRMNEKLDEKADFNGT